MHLAERDVSQQLLDQRLSVRFVQASKLSDAMSHDGSAATSPGDLLLSTG